VQYVKNERGMTLVIVLLTIVVFSVLGLAVISASVNNVKQVTKAESDIKTTDIAEMGVQYYETQLRNFLNQQLYNQEKQKELMNRLFNNTGMSEENLINQFKNTFPTELNNAYKTNNSLFTNSEDRLLQEKNVDANRSFKIKINPNGILKTNCINGMTSNSECFSISFDSYSFYSKKPEKMLSATYTFSYTINPESFAIVPSVPPLVDLHENLLNSIPDKKLRNCTTADFNNNNTKVDCSSNLDPNKIPSTNGISDSFIVFNTGVNFEHLSHAISQSTIFIYSTPTLTPTIGKFNPNGFIGSKIVIIGNAILNDKIMKPVGSSIFITGNANLSGFELKNSDDLTYVCIKGTIEPASMRSAEGVYSLIYNPTKYKEKCMESEKTIVTNSLKIKGDIINPRVDEKSKVTY
jgi:Tfp pilus assembly protein PilE